MTTDPELRVRQYIAALKVPAAPPIAHLLEPRRRVSARLVPVAAALAVLAVIALTLIRPIGAPVASGEGKPGLPDRFASYSSLTAPVSKSAPGTAIALYQHGLNFGRNDRAQAVVLGAFDDVYRRVDLAEKDDGGPVAMLLSPDGTRVAVGNRDGGSDLHLVDLATGKAEKLPAWPGQADGLTPIAWSRDGRYLLVLPETTARFPNPLLYDLTTREAPTTVSEGTSRAAAFSPDGKKLAYQAEEGLRVMDLATKVVVALPKPSAMSRAIQLAWSPDGQLLAAASPDERVFFADATGSGKPVPASVACEVAFVLAWTGPRTVLVGRNGFTEVNVESGESRRISEFDTSRVWPAESHELGSMSFAANLVVGMQSRPADAWPDRGPWPTWLRLTTIVCALVLAAAVALLVQRFRRRRVRA